MKKLIEGWKHIPGKHCASTALRDVMEYKGHRLSEEMCFGIGAGLGFFYLTSPFSSPTRIIMTRNANLEAHFFENIGIPFYWRTFQDEESALKTVKSWLDEDVPVLLQTDIYYVDYYNSKTHFSGHVVVAWGYDDEKEEIYLSDTNWEGLQKLSYSSLIKAWTSKIPPFFLDFNHFEVKDIPHQLDLEKVIKRAIQVQAFELLHPQGWGNESPVEKMRELSKSFPEWVNSPDWKWCARFAYQVIERRGTGGGAFRKLYSGFLREAEEILPFLKGSNFPSRMEEVALLWTKLSEILKGISEGEDGKGFKEAGKIMESISVEEEKIFRDILKITCGAGL